MQQLIGEKNGSLFGGNNNQRSRVNRKKLILVSIKLGLPDAGLSNSTIYILEFEITFSILIMCSLSLSTEIEYIRRWDFRQIRKVKLKAEGV